MRAFVQVNDFCNTLTYGETEVRVICDEGEVWFWGKDVCNILKEASLQHSTSAADANAKGHKAVAGASLPSQPLVSLAELLSLTEENSSAPWQKFRDWVVINILQEFDKNKQKNKNGNNRVGQEIALLRREAGNSLCHIKTALKEGWKKNRDVCATSDFWAQYHLDSLFDHNWAVIMDCIESINDIVRVRVALAYTK